jgi:ribose transport system permease protein
MAFFFLGVGENWTIMKKQNLLLSIISKRESAIFLALIAIAGFITIFAPHFASKGNLYLVSRQISFVTIVALGELFVILSSGIDLSVGSIIGLSGVVSGLSLAAGVPVVISLALGALAGLGVGMLNGVLVSYVLITPFIVTLGMQGMARGAVWVLTKGNPITDIPDSFFFIAQGDFLGIPVPVIIAGVLALIVHVVLTYTAFGRRVFAIGGNEEATALSGINVKTIKLMIYGISGLMCSFVGIILIARFYSAQPAIGDGWELDAIAATVIGGTSLMGGVGSVLGVLIGATIMGVIRNGLVLLKVSVYWQQLVIGAIIILAAVIDRLKNK